MGDIECHHCQCTGAEVVAAVVAVVIAGLHWGWGLWSGGGHCWGWAITWGGQCCCHCHAIEGGGGGGVIVIVIWGGQCHCCWRVSRPALPGLLRVRGLKGISANRLSGH